MERSSLREARPRFVSDAELAEAAETFVAALGSANADLLIRNLSYTTKDSDALRALKEALSMDASWRATSPDTAPVRWSSADEGAAWRSSWRHPNGGTRYV